MERNLYIAVHDYQSGAVILRIYASSKKEVAVLLPPSSWMIYDDTDPSRPRWENEAELDTSDLESPSELLQKLIFNQERQLEGKNSYTYKVVNDTGVEYRQIWARSQVEIEERFPKFQSMMFVPMGPEIFKMTGTSDIDVMDNFLRRHSK